MKTKHQYYIENKEKWKTIYYDRDKKLKYLKEYREKHKEERKKYIEENREKIRINQQKYLEKNRERIYKIRKKHEKERYWKDELFRLTINLRTRIGMALKNSGARKSYKTPKLLGAEILEVKKYIESLFEEGMTWDNYGYYGWHIDHKRPLCSFNLKDPKEQLLACHYTNLQPMWGIDNMKKHCKFEN
jgi:hypothetical protein